MQLNEEGKVYILMYITAQYSEVIEGVYRNKEDAHGAAVSLANDRNESPNNYLVEAWKVS